MRKRKKSKSIDGLSAPKKQGEVGIIKEKLPARRRVGRVIKPERMARQFTTNQQSKDEGVAVTSSETHELGEFTIEEKLSLEELAESVREIDKIDLELNSEELEKSKKNKAKEEKKSKKSKKAKKKWSRKRKILTALLIFLVLAGGVAGALLYWGNDIISKITNGESGIWDVLTVKEDVKLQTDSKGRTNILIFGTSGMEMEGSGHDGAQLTDSIMIVSLDQETKDVAMLSLPRDLLVNRTCTATGKVNEVYWCFNQDGTDEIAGAEALKAEVQDILGIEIQYYAHLNWGALIALVDSVGGITVTLDEDIADPWTQTYIDAGVPTELDGVKALGLARARHGTASGDFTRGNSQQKILIALKDKLTQSGIGLTEAINILNSLGDNLRMSFNLDEIKTGYNLLKTTDLASIRQISLVSIDGTGENYMTTATLNDISYVIPMAGIYEYSDLQAYIARMLSSNVAVREGAEIMVLNGSDEVGIASTERDKLQTDGYSVAFIDNAPQGEYPQSYYIYDITGDKTDTAKALAKRYDVKVQNAEELPWGIDASWVDFVIIIGNQESE